MLHRKGTATPGEAWGSGSMGYGASHDNRWSILSVGMDVIQPITITSRPPPMARLCLIGRLTN